MQILSRVSVPPLFFLLQKEVVYKRKVADGRAEKVALVVLSLVRVPAGYEVLSNLWWQ